MIALTLMLAICTPLEWHPTWCTVEELRYVESLGQPLPCVDALCWDADLQSYDHCHPWWPWVDRHLEQAKRLNVTMPGPNFQTYKGATALLVLDLRRAGVPRATIRKMVLDLREVEVKLIPKNLGGGR